VIRVFMAYLQKEEQLAEGSWWHASDADGTP
jgi:hypothetical protein